MAIAFLDPISDHVSWYCTEPRPWPWQADPTERHGNTDDDDLYTELDRITGADPDIEDADQPDLETPAELAPTKKRTPQPVDHRARTAQAAEARHTHLAHWLATRTGQTKAATLLAALTLIPFDDQEDIELVCRLLGIGVMTWPDYRAWVVAEIG